MNMSSPPVSRWHNTALASLLTIEIMSKHLPNETGSSRIRQLGMMIALLSMDDGHSPITIGAVTEFTGIARKTALEAIEPLVARGLLIETWDTASHGKGKSRLFYIPHDLLARFLPKTSAPK
jgi:hypothetical protein